MLYRVKDWTMYFERNHKDSEVAFRWVGVPTKHDGKSFRRVARHKNGPEIFAAFVLIVEVAAKQPVRGTLADENGPLGADDLADATGFPSRIFDLALKVLSEPKIGWIESVPSSDKFGQVGTSSEQVLTSSPTGQERTGEDRTEQRERAVAASPLGVVVKPGFSAFWATWPKHSRKVGRTKCARLWERQNLERISQEIIAAVTRSKKTRDWAKDGGAFIPMPYTWLNQGRWEAPPEDAPQGVGGLVTPDTFFSPPTEDQLEAIGLGKSEGEQ